MRYDDRDGMRPRRDDDEMPRSRSSSRPEYGSARPSRPEYGSNRPSRPRGPGERDSGASARPRPPTNMPRNGAPPPGGGSPNQSIGDMARDAARRVRKGLGNMVDAMSREMRALGDRVQEQRSRRSGAPGSNRSSRVAGGYLDEDAGGRAFAGNQALSYDDDAAPVTP